MKETITVHKALSELKTLAARIDKEMKIEFFRLNKHSNAKIGGIPVAEYMKDIADSFKSVRTLMNRRDAIKQAVTRSNAITTVNIGGKEYTVAEAIDMKSNGIPAQQKLLERIERQYREVTYQAEQRNGDDLDRRADEYVKALYENADMKNMSDEIKKVRETFVESQTFDILDPIGGTKVMKEMKDYIDSFMTEVDSALSVSNALTTVEVEYETL